MIPHGHVPPQSLSGRRNNSSPVPPGASPSWSPGTPQGAPPRPPVLGSPGAQAPYWQTAVGSPGLASAAAWSPATTPSKVNNTPTISPGPQQRARAMGYTPTVNGSPMTSFDNSAGASQIGQRPGHLGSPQGPMHMDRPPAQALMSKSAE